MKKTALQAQSLAFIGHRRKTEGEATALANILAASNLAVCAWKKRTYMCLLMTGSSSLGWEKLLSYVEGIMW